MVGDLGTTSSSTCSTKFASPELSAGTEGPHTSKPSPVRQDGSGTEALGTHRMVVRSTAQDEIAQSMLRQRLACGPT